jgi:hypothetical protein
VKKPVTSNYFFGQFLLFLILILHPYSTFSQSVNYPEIFGEDWNKAMNFVRENRSWMEPMAVRNNVSYPLAVAVIFPELVRYSALRDKMEISLLKALYINLGKDYANFSIGQFQMKPSFAENIRLEAPRFLESGSEFVFKNPGEYDDISNYRKSIVSDLESPETQLGYLIAFFKICEKNYNTNLKDEIDRLKFIATAYNCGIDKSASMIELMIDRKFFNTKLFRTENYSYSDVSLFWYNNYMAGR